MADHAASVEIVEALQHWAKVTALVSVAKDDSAMCRNDITALDSIVAVEEEKPIIL